MSDPNDPQLQRLEKMHQLILDAAGEGVYGLDANGITTFVNRAAERILGWHPDDVIGKPLHDIHHHSHADGSPYPREQCPIYLAIRDGQVHQVDDEVFWRTDGTSVPVEYTSTPIIEDGGICGAVVVFRDVSARKELERQREADYQQIKCLKEQLELERDYLRDEINVSTNFGEIIGDSQALKRTFAQIDAVATTSASVLINGDSGVGKETNQPLIVTIGQWFSKANAVFARQRFKQLGRQSVGLQYSRRGLRANHFRPGFPGDIRDITEVIEMTVVNQDEVGTRDELVDQCLVRNRGIGSCYAGAIIIGMAATVEFPA